MNPEIDASIKAALQLLKRRDYHSSQIRHKLIQKGHGPECVEDCINHLHQHNLICDSLHIENQVGHLLEKGYSAEYICQKLGVKKIQVSQDNINQISLRYDITPHDQIDRLISNFLRKQGPIDCDRDLARLSSLLLSRGHDSELVQESIISLLEDS